MARVLIVDDDADFANAIAKTVASDGHLTEIQLDTASAMKSIETRRPDLVILDVMFPENDTAGFEFARQLRNNDECKNMPILMLTAINAKSSLGFGAKDIDESWLPVDDFLEKPVDLNILKQRVAQMLQR
ncbi:MAG: hypothetical protein A2583_06215 [Bdellovibrionales bacterium RIFOXYD1_FULL_53_11]|nr:MAG: hypothetical protein A2583_06215 [Bdellovibrionales bacterium RIFOXYD1_FULL_53_11]